MKRPAPTGPEVDVQACRDCERDLWHCHGTLIRHPDGTVECSDDDCAGVDALHAFGISCADVSPACCADPSADVAAAPAALARGA